jgi:hypothetical protein
MDYTKKCWNCGIVVEGNKKDVKLFRDYYDESYMALVCSGCGAHATLTRDEEPKGWYWDYTKKCVILPE